jgi:hypothetical protein
MIYREGELNIECYDYGSLIGAGIGGALGGMLGFGQQTAAEQILNMPRSALCPMLGGLMGESFGN